jgi:hypothetical protein
MSNPLPSIAALGVLGTVIVAVLAGALVALAFFVGGYLLVHMFGPVAGILLFGVGTIYTFVYLGMKYL